MKRIGIPCVFGLDQNHGSTYTQGGTLFPQNINVAATFNREIARRSAEATAYQTRAVSVPWTDSPTVDLGRDARWPRIWENFGEDCPMELSSYFRINARNTGQFERTLIIADDDSTGALFWESGHSQTV